MIFESLWPLAFVLAVPIIIVLYLLVPKGKEYKISSNLLWKKLYQNQQSKTFLEKFIHNLLMYLQIVIILLLVLALMSPYIRKGGTGSGNVVYVLDTSGSMQPHPIMVSFLSSQMMEPEVIFLRLPHRIRKACIGYSTRRKPQIPQVI